MIATSSLDSTVESYQYKIQSCDTLETLENLRLEILGKNGFITQQLKILCQLKSYFLEIVCNLLSNLT